MPSWTTLRDDFPVLDQKVHGKPLIYLDNAATVQKPKAVLDALQALHSPKTLPALERLRDRDLDGRVKRRVAEAEPFRVWSECRRVA